MNIYLYIYINIFINIYIFISICPSSVGLWLLLRGSGPGPPPGPPAGLRQVVHDPEEQRHHDVVPPHVPGQAAGLHRRAALPPPGHPGGRHHPPDAVLQTQPAAVLWRGTLLGPHTHQDPHDPGQDPHRAGPPGFPQRRRRDLEPAEPRDRPPVPVGDLGPPRPAAAAQRRRPALGAGTPAPPGAPGGVGVRRGGGFSGGHPARRPAQEGVDQWPVGAVHLLRPAGGSVPLEPFGIPSQALERGCKMGFS